MTKACKNCQESKPLDRFTTDGRTRDGLRKVCEDCRTATAEQGKALLASLKRCAGCQESKARSDFPRHHKPKDGLSYWCWDCTKEHRASKQNQSPSEAPVPVSVEPETREQQNGAQTAAESHREALADYENTFADMTRDLDTPQTLDVPWPFEDDWELTEEQLEAVYGITIALLRGDSMGSKFLMSQVCTTWKDVAVIHAFVSTSMAQSLQDSGYAECLIRAAQNIIHERAMA